MHCTVGLTLFQRAFGVPPLQVALRVDAKLEEYGGWNLQAAKVLPVAGAIDPWTELSMQKSADSDHLPVYHVPGASHHFWTTPTTSRSSRRGRSSSKCCVGGWMSRCSQFDVAGGGGDATSERAAGALGSPLSLLRLHQGFGGNTRNINRYSDAAAVE